MNREELFELFDEYRNEFLRFEKVANPRSRRPDLHAFYLLDSLCPGDGDMVSYATHDEIGLGINLDDFMKVVTKEQVIELIRCGVRLSYDYCRLTMFV